MGRCIHTSKELKRTDDASFSLGAKELREGHQIRFSIRKQDSAQEEAFNDALQLFLRELVRQERNQKGGL
jgi:uncharacterized protein YggE